MVSDSLNFSPNKTAFTVSIEASEGVTTGISAADRSHTIRVASNPEASPSDVMMPGHVFPIRAQEGGVLRRAGHTEASVDLARLAGLNHAGVICEIMNEDGSMARTPDLMEFAKTHNIKMATIEDLIEYRIQHETLIEEMVSAPFATSYGEGFNVHLFRNKLDGSEHLAFVKGDIDGEKETLVRVHNASVLGDAMGSLDNLSQTRLQKAFQKIDAEGAGVLLYLRLEGSGDRLLKSIQRYMDDGEDISRNTFMDQKDYGVGAQILRSLGVSKMCLISNNPQRLVGLKGYGLEVVRTMSLPKEESKKNTHQVLEL